MTMERKIVVLGMMSKMPVPGVVWQTVHYLVGLQRLGFSPYYVEAHARTPSMLMEGPGDDASGRAAELIADVLGDYGLGGRWAFHALHDDGRCYGMTGEQLRRLYAEAELVINLHGGTEPREELASTGRLVYLETDPVQLQIELHDGVQESHDFLDAHCAFFSFAENMGTSACDLPVSGRHDFRPTRQPVVLDLWAGHGQRPGTVMTTIANWRQGWRSVRFEGERLGWSKDEQWAAFLDLPARTGTAFEVALSGCEPADVELLERHGWGVRPALDFASDRDAYRRFITGSRGEFTVAKEQNVRFATGWFSDRSATYLAAGRPVVTQDTGFGTVLPTGEGLFAVRDVNEAAAAVAAIAADPARHARAAGEIAREHFDAERVLGRLLNDMGVALPTRSSTMADQTHENLHPEPGNGERLAQEPAVAPARERPRRRTLGPSSRVLALIPHFRCEEWLDDCLGSLVAQTRPLDGIVVIDDASDEPPIDIVARYPSVTLLHAAENVGPYRLVQQVIDDTDYDAYLFQDADDWSAPDRLEHLLAHAERTGAEMLGSQEVRVFCDEPEVAPIAWPLDANAPFRERATAFTLLHPTSLVSSDLLAELGGFASGLRFGGDAELLRRAQHLARLANTPHHGYFRRIRRGSLTTAPATAIGTPARKQLMEETFARANRNAELVAEGGTPDLTPLRTAPPVVLRRLIGPRLSTSRDPLPAPEPVRAVVHATGGDAAAVGPPQPIFVVGADRSGATAVACALGQHPELALCLHDGWLDRLSVALEEVRAGALEEDELAFGAAEPTPARFGAIFGESVSRLAGGDARRWVGSAWQHADDLQRLVRLFPDAQFVHVVRDVHSAVRAVTDPPLGSAGATGGTQIPARLRTKVGEPEAVERWVRTMEACSETLPADRLLTVTHAELIADPERLVRRCLEFAGEEFDATCMRPLRELRSLVDTAPLEPDVEPELWRRALQLNDRVLGTAGGRPPRIVMVTDHFPKVSETFFVDKFLGLLERGWDVHVVSHRSNKEHWEFFPGLREQAGARLHVAREELDGAIAALAPDIIHFGYGNLATGHTHLREALGCRIVVSFRGFDLNSVGVGNPAHYDDVWRSADLVHTVSESMWRRARECGCPAELPHAIVTDAVDPRRFAPPERDGLVAGTAERPLRILSVGRLSWKKGHETALQAVAILRERGLETTYKIAGEGEHREPTSFAIGDLGLDRQVELLGWTSAEDVAELLAWADVLVHPSLTEGFGVAVAEAQAMGLPVICSDAGGLPENVADGESGFVVPRRDPHALADHLAQIAESPRLRERLGAGGRRRAETALSAQTQLDRFEELYRGLLERRPAEHLPRPAGERDAVVRARRHKLDEIREVLDAYQQRWEALAEQVWRREVVEAVRDHVETQVPQGTTVLVISRGDEQVISFDGRSGAHFPQARGGYAGHHPADSAEAIAHLEELRAAGADYLVVPGTSQWWLEYYEEFARHLDATAVRSADVDGTLVAWDLRGAGDGDDVVAAESRVQAKV